LLSYGSVFTLKESIMATKNLKLANVNGQAGSATKSTRKIEVALRNKADAAARLEYLQDRQRQANALREQGYLGNDETVFAHHWLDTAFSAVPSLAKWASTKLTRDGRKPSVVQLKGLVFDWIHQPVNAATKAAVYAALTQKGGE
jgi:hypothetical protein